MDKSETISIVLGIIFIFALIIYSTTSSVFTLLLHFFLLISAFLISILMINKTTKSKNSLKSKIYFSLIISLFIFFLIIFFWFLGNHARIDEKRLTTTLIITPSVTLFAVISFIIGLILAIKRKRRRDFEYNLKVLPWIFSILFLMFLILFFYNSILFNLAVSTNSVNLCYLTISPNLNSYLFNQWYKQDCLLKIAIEKSKSGKVICEQIENAINKRKCYIWSAVNKKDIKICINNADSETEILKYNDYCSTAISYLEEDIYNILKSPQHTDISYALKSVHYSLGICYGDERRYIPLLKEIIKQGSLTSKKEALDILIEGAYCLGENSLEGEKEFLRTQILPLIENQTELKDYVAKINQRLNALPLPSSTSNIRTG